MATRISAALVLGLLLLGSAPAWAAGISVTPTDQIVLFGRASVPRGSAAGEIVVFLGSATVAGVAYGDVVVVSGPIVVTGQVSGSVVAVTGDVRLGRGAQVRGDVLAGGEVEAAAGARVSGEVREGVRFTLRGWLDTVAPFLGWIGLSASTLLLAFALVLLAPRGLDAVHRTVRASPWASAGWGLLALVGLPTLAVLLVLSVVGLPLGLAALLALVPLSFVGFALAAWAVGRLLWRPPRSRWPALLLGWLIASLAIGIPYLGPVVWAAGSALGLGAAAVAIWRAREHGGRHRPSRTAPGIAAPEAPEPIEGEIGL